MKMRDIKYQQKLIYLLCLVISACSVRHRFDEREWVGKKVEEISETENFKGYKKLDARFLGDGYILNYYIETKTRNMMMLVCRELRGSDVLLPEGCEVIDVLKIKEKNNECVMYGSYEEIEDRLSVITIETGNCDSIWSSSNNILNAWIFRPEHGKFDVFSTEGLYRVNEGYYRRKGHVSN